MKLPASNRGISNGIYSYSLRSVAKAMEHRRQAGEYYPRFKKSKNKACPEFTEGSKSF